MEVWYKGGTVVIRLVFAFLVMGFIDIIQVLLVREFIINFQGNELSLGVILANWMILMALGSWQLGKLADKISKKITVFIITQILIAFILVIEILFARSINNLMSIKPGEVVGLFTIFYSSLIVLIPIGILHGFQFALSSRIISSRSNTPAIGVGKVYICEAVGMMIGGILFTYLLVIHLQPLEIVLCIGLLSLASALFLLKPEIIAWKSRREWGAKLMVGIVVLTMGVGLHFLVSRNLDSLHDISVRWQWWGYNLVSSQNSVYGNVSITEKDGQFNFYESGLPIFSMPNPDIAFNEEVIHFPMLHHRSPTKVLLIGGGVGGTLEQVLQHPVDEVHYAELDPLIIKAARDSLPRFLHNALDDVRVSIKYIDGRYFVKNSLEKYDVIIVTLPSPSTLQLNRLYTREFFIEISNILKPGGIFSTAIISSEIYLSKEMIDHNRCIYETLKGVFNNLLIIPGNHNILLASEGGKLIDENINILCQRLENRKLETKLLNADYIEYKLDKARIELLLTPILSGPKTPVNRDLHPIGSYYNLALWNSMFYPDTAGFFHWISQMRLWWFGIPAGILLFLSLVVVVRRKMVKPKLMPVAIAIVTTGFVGITFSIILLLSLQTLEGYLYQKIALIIAAFMLGLALGGAYMNRILYRIRREFLALSRIEFIIVVYSISVALILSLLLADIAKLPSYLPAEIFFSIFNCIAGFLAGLEFPLVNKICLADNKQVGAVAGSLYAADLFGGCVGAILASVFLVPILGVPQTCFMIALLKGASFVFLLASAMSKK